MNQTDLGAAIGTISTHVSKWENEEITPGVEAVLKIASATNCDLVWLLTGERQERVALEPGDRALLEAYRRADENQRRIVRLALELEEPKGDKHNLPLALRGKKKAKPDDK